MQLLVLFLLLFFGCQQDFSVIDTVETTGYLGYDSFQTVDQAVDILFLVDESGSMSDDIERINLALPDMYSVLTGNEFTDLQWRVGIRSMDPTKTIYAYVDWDDPDADLKLMTLTSFSSGWGYAEAGLDAAMLSLAWDKGFYRDNADLLFIFLSDETDQSSVTVDYYKSFMDQVKQDPFIVTESAIITTEDSPCASSGSSIGYGYIEVSEVITDICDTEDWIDSLDVVRDHLPYVNTRFTLSQIPIVPYLENIRVFINTVETFDYEYDPTNNVVTLDEPPSLGSTVEVVYLIEE